MRILVVEDKRKYLDILLRSVRVDGYTVDGTDRASLAVELLQNYHYDLVILDLQLPDGTGNSLLRRIRQNGQTMPVLILAAHSGVECRIENFQAGAGDYVVKPVALAELTFLVQALLRRGPALRENVLRVSDLEINRLTRQVMRDGKRIELSPKEYSLLEYMFLHPGRVLSRNMIVERIWDQSFEGLTNIVDVHIGNLRRKVDQGRDHKLIRTVRGLGYMLEAEL